MAPSVGKSTYCTKLRVRVQIASIHIKPGHAVYSSVIPALGIPEKGRPVKFCCCHCYCCFCLISIMQMLYAKGIRWRTVAQGISHLFLSSISTYMSEHMCAWTTPIPHISKTHTIVYLVGWKAQLIGNRQPAIHEHSMSENWDVKEPNHVLHNFASSCMFFVNWE